MDSALSFAIYRVVRKWVYQRSILRWNSLPLLKRLFKRRPVDPFPYQTLESLAVEANKCFGEHYSKDGCCCVYMDSQRKKSLPVVIFKGWYGGCCFMSRKAFDFDGSYAEWGCCAPYDECGLSALPSEHGINDAQDLETLFESKVKEMADILRTLRDKGLGDNI